MKLKLLFCLTVLLSLGLSTGWACGGSAGKADKSSSGKGAYYQGEFNQDRAQQMSMVLERYQRKVSSESDPVIVDSDTSKNEGNKAESVEQVPLISPFNQGK